MTSPPTWRAFLHPGLVWAVGLGLLLSLGAGSVQAQQDLGELLAERAPVPDGVRVGDAGRGGLELRRSGSYFVAVAYGGIEARASGFDLRCDRAVFWLPADAVQRGRGGRLPIQALYADGHVRAQNRGAIIEADRAFFDVLGSRAILLDSRARGTPIGDGDAALGGTPFFLRAERLSLFGTRTLLGERVSVTSCDFADPHFEIVASRLTVEAAGAERASAISGLGGLAGAMSDPGGHEGLLSELFEARLRARRSRGRSRRRRVSSEGSPSAAAEQGEVTPPAGPASSSESRGLKVGSDGLAGLSDTARWIELDDVRLEVGDVPVFYLPKLLWRSDWDVLPKIRFGSSSAFGRLVSLDWSLPLTAPGRGGASGRGLRDGLASSIQPGVAYSSRRGVSGSLGVRWKYYDAGRRASRGRGRGTYLADRGRDQSGAMVERDSRGFVRLAQQTELFRLTNSGGETPQSLRLDAELSLLSDRDYLLEFEERIAKTDKAQENYLYAHWRRDHLMATALGRVRLNRFFSRVERAPELTFDMFSQPLFENPWLPGGATLSASAAAAHLRLRPDDDLPRSSERLLRLDGQLELDEKVAFGPLILRSFARQRATAFERTANDGPETLRLASAAGAQLATTLWRPFGDRWTHVLVPRLGYFNRFETNRDPADLIAIDEVDGLTETEFVSARLRQRLSRLSEDGEGYDDIVDLVVEGRYFPRSGDDNGRRNFGPVLADLRLRYPGLFSFRVRSDVDVSRGRALSVEGSVSVRPYEALEMSVSYRDLDEVSRALGWSALWRLSEKWNLRVEEQYDFLTSRFTTHRATLRRRFHRFALDVSLSVDPGEDDLSFSFQLAPDLFGSAGQDVFREGRLSGLAY